MFWKSAKDNTNLPSYGHVCTFNPFPVHRKRFNVNFSHKNKLLCEMINKSLQTMEYRTRRRLAENIRQSSSVESANSGSRDKVKQQTIDENENKNKDSQRTTLGSLQIIMLTIL